MTVLNVELTEESKTRYLTYALSVVNSRALPDVRDGLKPVQRRILYAMAHNLGLLPGHQHRKSAAVVGEVLARFHPHGDSACYEALVRMAQDFSLRYPLVDGQGNFGSLDGDSAAAYRYTEARLRPLAIEVIGDLGEETVEERDNFDQTTKEPVVLPSRVPNLLINGAAGIAVGMATSIPPHNLGEVIKCLLLLLENRETSDNKLLSTIKGPDFPTGGLVLNNKAELLEIYSTGRGAIRMRGEYLLEETKRGKRQIVITSIPYNVDKSQLVESIADLVITRRLSQLVDVRDESTAEVRIVLDLSANGDAEKIMAYLFKHTALQTNFNVNLTAVVPTENPLVGKPEQLSLKGMLEHFLDFRLDVTRRKLLFEEKNLLARIHLLEGLMRIIAKLDEVIELVRKSSGRADASEKLQKRFKLSTDQAFYIIDLRIYQLSKTSIEEVQAELNEKRTRAASIVKILKSDRALRGELSTELKRIAQRYSDARRTKIIYDFLEPVFEEEEYVEEEDNFVVVTKDGWLKRIKATNEPANTRIREGDALFFVKKGSTRDFLAIFTTAGNVYSTRVFDLIQTSGFGEPVQKIFRFGDGEQIISCCLFSAGDPSLGKKELLLCSKKGIGFRVLAENVLSETKKIGRKICRPAKDDQLAVVTEVKGKLAMFCSANGFVLTLTLSEIPVLSGAGKGVALQRIGNDDALVVAVTVDRTNSIYVLTEDGNRKKIDISSLTIGNRARRGERVIKKAKRIIGLAQAT